MLGSVPQVAAAMETINQLTAQGLMETCLECCTSFNPGQLSLDAHADTFISNKKLTSEADCSFVKQVLYGTTRYHALLKSFVDAFYRKNRYMITTADGLQQLAQYHSRTFHAVGVC